MMPCLSVLNPHEGLVLTRTRDFPLLQL